MTDNILSNNDSESNPRPFSERLEDFNEGRLSDSQVIDLMIDLLNLSEIGPVLEQNFPMAISLIRAGLIVKDATGKWVAK